MKHITILIFLLLAVTFVNADTKVDETISADNIMEVYIDNRAGAVSIQGWNKEQIRVEGTIGKNVERLDCYPDGKKAVIKAVIKKKHTSGKIIACNLTIYVPMDRNLVINTVSADINLQDVTSSIKAESVSGNVEIDTAAAELDITSVSGNINIKGTSGELKVQNTSGEVDITGNYPDAYVKTVSGEVTYGSLKVSKVIIKTTSADIKAICSALDNAQFHLNSTSGDIRVRLDENSKAALSLRSLSGSIKVASEFHDQLKTDNGRMIIDGQDSTSEILADSVSGSITISS